MRHRVVSLSTYQTAKVLALWYFLMGILYVPILFLAESSAPRDERIGPFWILAPILFAIAGFVFAAIGCAVYNFAASKTGGIELELESEPDTLDTGFVQSSS